MKRLNAITLLTSFALLAFYSCDNLESDNLPQEENILNISEQERIIYIKPAGEGVINLSDKVTTANTVRLIVDKGPVNGALELMEKGIYKYIAKATFTTGSDNIIFSVFSDSQELDRDTVTVKVLQDTVDIPCSYGASPDELVIREENFVGKTYSLNILDNDKICSNSYEVKQLRDANEGTSYIENDVLYYTPANTSLLQSSDQVVYELCQNIDGETVCSTALVTISHQKKPCKFSINDDFFKVAYRNIDTLYYLDVFNNDSICSDNVDFKVVDSGDINVSFKDGKIVLPLEGGLVFPAVVDFHYAIKYSVCQEGSGCQTATVKVYINQSCNTKAVDDQYELEYYHNAVGDTSTFRLLVLENDVICTQKKALSISSQPGAGALVEFVDDIAVFKHDSDRWGEYSFTYQVCDENQNCSEAKVSLNISVK